MMNWTSIESQKGVTVVTAWPVNHLQSAFFPLFIAWCVKIRTFSMGGFKTLRGNEEPCGSSTADVWKLCRMWPFGFDLLAAERNWNLDFLVTWRYLTPIIHQGDTHAQKKTKHSSCSCNKINSQKYDRLLTLCSKPPKCLCSVSYRDSMCFWPQRLIMKCPH